MEMISSRQRLHQYLYVVPGNHGSAVTLAALRWHDWVQSPVVATLLITTTEERQQAISDCHWLGVTLRATDDLTLELIEYILELTLTQLILLSYLSVL